MFRILHIPAVYQKVTEHRSIGDDLRTLMLMGKKRKKGEKEREDNKYMYKQMNFETYFSECENKWFGVELEQVDSVI